MTKRPTYAVSPEKPTSTRHRSLPEGYFVHDDPSRTGDLIERYRESTESIGHAITGHYDSPSLRAPRLHIATLEPKSVVVPTDVQTVLHGLQPSNRKPIEGYDVLFAPGHVDTTLTTYRIARVFGWTYARDSNRSVWLAEAHGWIKDDPPAATLPLVRGVEPLRQAHLIVLHRSTNAIGALNTCAWWFANSARPESEFGAVSAD